MRLTERNLRRVIQGALEILGEAPDALPEDFQGNNWDASAEYLKRGDSVSAMNKVLNHYMMDDTWHSEEDALEDLLIDLGPNPTAKDVEDLAFHAHGLGVTAKGVNVNW